MLSLMRVQPPGKLETTVQGLKMYHIFHGEFNIAEHIQLGGMYCPILRGLTPAILIPPHIPAIVPPMPQIPVLPLHTQESEEARDPQNWRIRLL